jgi:hypothetical protein
MASSSSSSFFDIEPLDCCREICPWRHAMDACSLRRKRLAKDRDIFMYRLVVCTAVHLLFPSCF